MPRGQYKTLAAHRSPPSIKQPQLGLWKVWNFQQRGQRYRGQQKDTHGRVGCRVCPILEDSKCMLSQSI